MIPLTDNEDQTLRLLGKAIKSVSASVYFASSRAYILASGNLLSEEKMGIVIQEVCGSEDGGYYFPTVSGVARSLNYYPIGDEKPEDGIVNLAFGLGKLIVDGGLTLRFAPLPEKRASALDARAGAARHAAGNVRAEPEARAVQNVDRRRGQSGALRDQQGKAFPAGIHQLRVGLGHAEPAHIRQPVRGRPADHHVLADTQVRHDPARANHRRPAPHGRAGDGLPGGMEFAVDMDVPYGAERTFCFLQIRPIVEQQDARSLDWDSVRTSDALIYAESALGLGAIEGVTDVVYVRSGTFDTSRTQRIASEIGELNNRLRSEKRPYVLVGPGRWGSSDPWLGIPVEWPSISEAKVIVECGLENFRVEPSQGTHFSQNLTSFGVGYLTINPFMGDGRFDEERLDAMPAVYESESVRHVRVRRPAVYLYRREKKQGHRPRAAGIGRLRPVSAVRSYANAAPQAERPPTSSDPLCRTRANRNG